MLPFLMTTLFSELAILSRMAILNLTLKVALEFELTKKIKKALIDSQTLSKSCIKEMAIQVCNSAS